MPAFESIVEGFRRECAEDYVGLWQISRALKDVSGESGIDRILEVVAALLTDANIAVGQFENDHFVEWHGSPEERIDRVRRELILLGVDPDIGDVAWLVQRPD